MADELMYIPNDDTQNCLLCRLQLAIETFGYSTNEPTNPNSMKVPKVVNKENTIIKLWGLV